MNHFYLDIETLLENIIEDPTMATSTTAIVVALAAASTPLALFPPLGVPQPGEGGGSSGAGATVASIASVRNEVFELIQPFFIIRKIYQQRQILFLR